MARPGMATIAQIVAEDEEAILADWLERLKADGALDSGQIGEDELRTECRAVLRLLGEALAGDNDASGASYDGLKSALAEIMRSRAAIRVSPREAAALILFIKPPLFEALGRKRGFDPVGMARASWAVSRLVDELGLYGVEAFGQARDEFAPREREAEPLAAPRIADPPAPVIAPWKGVALVPLSGALDAERMGAASERLLEAIAEDAVAVAILDFAQVPSLDGGAVAELAGALEAVRLTGATCVFSGIRPSVARAMAQGGRFAGVAARAALADALALALGRLGYGVVALAGSGGPA